MTLERDDEGSAWWLVAGQRLDAETFTARAQRLLAGDGQTRQPMEIASALGPYATWALNNDVVPSTERPEAGRRPLARRKDDVLPGDLDFLIKAADGSQGMVVAFDYVRFVIIAMPVAAATATALAGGTVAQVVFAGRGAMASGVTQGLHTLVDLTVTTQSGKRAPSGVQSRYISERVLGNQDVFMAGMAALGLGFSRAQALQGLRMLQAELGKVQ